MKKIKIDIEIEGQNQTIKGDRNGAHITFYRYCQKPFVVFFNENAVGTNEIRDLASIVNQYISQLDKLEQNIIL